MFKALTTVPLFNGGLLSFALNIFTLSVVLSFFNNTVLTLLIWTLCLFSIMSFSFGKFVLSICPDIMRVGLVQFAFICIKKLKLMLFDQKHSFVFYLRMLGANILILSTLIMIAISMIFLTLVDSVAISFWINIFIATQAVIFAYMSLYKIQNLISELADR